MTYSRRLTLALRSRQAGEPLIADVLHEINQHNLTDDALEQEFGTPENYAEQIVPHPPRQHFGPVLLVGLIAALLWLAVLLLNPLWGWNLRSDMEGYSLVPSLALLLLGIGGQFLTDYFRPVTQAPTS